MYVIPFTSLAGTNYEVRIGTGTRQTLKGAAQPFVTEEDDNDDMFFPIRLQTGYVRIIDTAGIWKNLMPATAVSLPVELYRGQMLMWRGFMKPETYSGAYLELPQERSFPIVCQLSVLESFDVEPITPNNTANIAGILHYIFSKIGTWDYLVFQGIDAVNDWLTKELSWLNFINSDADGQTTTKYNCLELLEEICKFFGWTCRTYAGNVFFVAPTTAGAQATGFQMITMAQLYDISNGYAVNPHNVEFADEGIFKYANDQNTEEYVQGVNKVTVTADIDKISSILSIPFDKIANDFRGASTTITTVGNTNYIRVNHDVTSYEDNNIVVDFRSNQAQYPVNSGKFQADEKFEGDIQQKHNFDFRYSAYLVCNSFSQDMADYCMHIRTKNAYSFRRGMLTINAAVKANDYDSFVVRLKLGVRIGGMWWSGSEWVNYASTFDVETDGNVIPDSRQLQGPYDAYTGFGVPITSPMGGVLEVYVFGISIGGQAPWECHLTSLDIGFALLQSESVNSDRPRNTYEHQNGSRFAASREVQLAFFTNDRNAFAMNALMNNNGSFTTQLPYSDSQDDTNFERPEVHLVETIAAYYYTRKVKLRLNITENDHSDIDPFYLIYDPQNNVTTYPIAISHDWAANIVTLTLLEI